MGVHEFAFGFLPVFGRGLVVRVTIDERDFVRASRNHFSRHGAQPA